MFDLVVHYEHGDGYTATAPQVVKNVSSVSASFTISPTAPKHNQTITLASNSAAQTGATLYFDWDVLAPNTQTVLYELGLCDGDHPVDYQCVIPPETLDCATYDFRLTLTNTGNEDQDTALIENVFVATAYPQLDFTWAPTNPEIGAMVVYRVQGVLPNDIEQAAWDFGGSGCDGASRYYTCVPGSVPCDLARLCLLGRRVQDRHAHRHDHRRCPAATGHPHRDGAEHRQLRRGYRAPTAFPRPRGTSRVRAEPAPSASAPSQGVPGTPARTRPGSPSPRVRAAAAAEPSPTRSQPTPVRPGRRPLPPAARRTRSTRMHSAHVKVVMSTMTEPRRTATGGATAATSSSDSRPASYPYVYTDVCVAFTQAGGDPDLSFDVLILDDDGPGGGPGTLLASIPAVAAGVPAWLDHSFFSVDVEGRISRHRGRLGLYRGGLGRRLRSSASSLPPTNPWEPRSRSGISVRTARPGKPSRTHSQATGRCW